MRPLRNGCSTLLLGLLLAGACRQKEATGPSFELIARFDSTLELSEIEVWGELEDGREALVRRRFEVPLSLDPPGRRSVTFSLNPELLDARAFLLKVEGFNEAEQAIAVGQASVPQLDSRAASVEVALGAPSQCGDGRVFAPSEQCDDGNQSAGDGCNAACAIEEGWRCSAFEPSRCGRCGDGVVDGPEQCDDGNLVGGDGCGSSCMLEDEGGPRWFRFAQQSPQSTESPEFEEVPDATLSVTPNEPQERWLLLVSGTLSNSESVGELRVMVDDAEVDRLGHQTLQGSSAGFLTFETLTLSAPAQVRVEHRAPTGVTTTAQLRLVAARLPPGADAQHIENHEVIERAGLDLDLHTLPVSVDRPGRYIVLAKGSVSEAPGSETAQIWFEDHRGAPHPSDEKGARFSNGRGALVPMFTAVMADLEAGDHRFAIKGSSSGIGGIAGWWNTNYAHRLPISVTAGQTDLNEGTAVQVTIEHDGWIELRRALADGKDVRVVQERGGEYRELPRVLDDASAWARPDTRLWFSLSQPIGANEEDTSYAIYFGNSQAGAPPADPRQIFLFHDTFDDPLDTSFWEVDALNLIEVDNGMLTVFPQAGVRSSALFGLQTWWEAKARVSVPMADFLLYWVANIPGAFNQPNGVGFFLSSNGHGVGNMSVQQVLNLQDPTGFHEFGFYRGQNGGVRYEVDGQAINAFSGNSPVEPAEVFMENRTPDQAAIATMQYEWVRVRAGPLEPPLVQAGELETLSGADLSRWSHLKILAFRADAFERVEALVLSEASATSSPEPLVLGSLRTEAPERSADYLTIQSVRISGDSSGVAPKVGQVRAGAEALRTEHIITRDGSAYFGYHHIAGMAEVMTTESPIELELSAESPMGIQVEAADASIFSLRYPPAQ